MTSCSLVAPGLASEVSGAVPTFSYRRTGHAGDYFGVQMTYLNGRSTCYQTGALPGFTPVIKNTAAGYTVNCQFLTQGLTYTGIYCPPASVTSIPDGVLTVSYINSRAGQPTPIPCYATFGPSPLPRAVTATAGAVATSIATSTLAVSPSLASTATVYAASTTQTYTSTIIVTRTSTTTNTNYVSSCASPPLASSSSRPGSHLSPALSSSSSLRPSSAASSDLATPGGISNSCPADNGKLVSTSAGTFKIVCGYDRASITTGPFRPGNGILGCINLCANTLNCLWSSYFYVTGDCYLKFGIGIPTYNFLVNGAELVSPASSSTPAPSFSSAFKISVLSQIPTSPLPASSSAVSSPAASRASGSSASSSNAASTSTPPSPSLTRSTSPSSSRISSSSNSAAPSWSSATPSSSSAPATSFQPAPSASSTRASSSSAAPSASAPGLACPADNGKQYTVGTKIFQITCQYDRTGSTTGPFQTGRDLTGCVTLCANTNGCLWSTYFAGQGTCFLKFGQGKANYNSIASGANWINQPGSSSVASTSALSSTVASSTAAPTQSPSSSAAANSLSAPAASRSSTLALSSLSPAVSSTPAASSAPSRSPSSSAPASSNPAASLSGAASSSAAASRSSAAASSSAAAATSSAAASPSSAPAQSSSSAPAASSSSTPLKVSRSSSAVVPLTSSAAALSTSAATSLSSAATSNPAASSSAAAPPSSAAASSGAAALSSAAVPSSQATSSSVPASSAPPSSAAASGGTSPASATPVQASSSSAASPTSTGSAGANPSCPGDDGKTFTTTAGTFVIECYEDRFNNDLEPVSAPDYSSCLNICAATSGCRALSYIPSGSCYLKNGLGAPSTNADVWGARLLTGTSITSSGATSSASSTGLTASVASSSPAASSSSAASSSPVASSTSVISSSLTALTSPGATSSPAASTSAASSNPAATSGAASSTSAAASRSSAASSGFAASSSPVASTLSSATRPSSSADVVPSGFATSSAAAPTVTSTLASCPSDNGKTINTAAGTFVIECYVDRAGGDLSTVYPDGGFYGCIQACANTPNCVDVSYSPDGPCYLKVAQSTPNTNSGIWGARLAGQAASSAASGSLAASSAASSGAVSSAGASTRTELSSVAPTATSSSPAATATGSGNSPSCPSSDGQIFYYNGDVYDIQCYTDYAGGDLPNSPQYFSDFGDCINACATDEACNTISFVGGTCYLKSTTKPGNSNQNVWGARQIGTYDSSTTQIASSLTARVSTSGAASTTGSGATATSTGPAATSSVVCPGSDGQTINTQAGTFVVECGIDRAGGDMSNSPVYPGSYENCVTTCAARDGCVDVSYANGPCYLKSVAGNPSQNVGIIGGRLISGPSSSGAVSSSSGAASASGASSTGASPTGASSTGDSSPAAATSRAATSGVVTPVQTVTVTTTIGGTGYQCTCTPTSGLASGPASSGAASTPAASATAGAQLDCPASDGSTYTSSCGATYKIECYSDRYGDDITRGTSYVNSLDECIADCDSTDGCVDVSYVPESPGPCYKKSSVAQIRQNDNIYGALQLTGCKNTKLKIHRKRVIRSLTTPKKMIQKRGVYGPDYTYTQGTTTVTQTTTSTSVRYATVTMTPASVGTTTRTVYTTASATTTVTNGATVVQTQQATITTCPAVTATVF